ncbi:NADH-quinone oxidoreductase subunit N [Paenibacillus radicis (ex Gao et al. 2016)]|uniref:NADH-quinone oxidoreductase subunit N n=1 Tax=Paenibacillus radicis (ex Gao et al. 2016) TaxID=1737354 RepID=A0A917HP32_9BACL|nr:NADH-quinone oxidoreductase subunit N [Paenibacillus radicis (ex Gao et al. 2016)]GGG84896.1 NADH-quinone oxidoreductase subunit N [Paenibacillus radicis (ex Gao et al. 2016)]
MYEGVSFLPLTWPDMLYMAPELFLAAVFLLLVVADLLLPQKVSRLSIGWMTVAGLLGAAGFVVYRLIDLQGSGREVGQVIELLGASYVVDQFANLLKLVFLAGTALVALMALGSVKQDKDITDRAELFYLLLPAAIGAMIMASSGNLVTLYIGLELLSITSYVLVALRRRSSKSAEAAFKYVVIGGISSAFILFGMSYLYGLTGSVDLGDFRTALPEVMTSYPALMYAGFFFLIAGFAIKIAAAPFHAWAPDVYQGAPTPVSAFLAVVSKGAALAAVLRILYNSAFFISGGGGGGVKPVGNDVYLALLVLAAAAMLAGTTAALRQRQMKRLLALSGVANAGYLLVPIGLNFTTVHSSNVSEFIFYLIVYLLMTIGAFAVLTVISQAAGHEELKGFSGLYYRAPWTSAAMVVFILSLAGLPVSGGFFAKLFILMGAASAKAYWLVAIMVISSVISYYFYFAIVRQMFMRSSSEEESEIRVSAPTGIVIWLCAGATVALGLMPGLLMDWIQAIFTIRGDLLIGLG